MDPLKLFNYKIIMEHQNPKNITNLNLVHLDNINLIEELMGNYKELIQLSLKDVILEKPLIIKFVILLLNVIFVPISDNVVGVKLWDNVYLTVLNQNAHILSFSIEKNVSILSLKDVNLYQILPLKLLISLILN
jgi:hypothetical protein